MRGFEQIAMDDEGARGSNEFRMAQLEIARANRAIAEEERELAALDDAIVGTDHVELRRLRGEDA